MLNCVDVEGLEAVEHDFDVFDAYELRVEQRTLLDGDRPFALERHDSLQVLA